MRIGLIGTGLMGLPMGMRIRAAGFDLAAFNRTVDKTTPLRDAGAAIASSTKELVDDVDVVVVMLLHKPAIEAMMQDVLVPGGLSGKTVVQMSTIAPEESKQLAKAVSEAGGEYIEAPVLGSTPQAADGKLAILVGGDEALFGRVQELLSAMGAPKRVGEIGDAAVMKLAMNQLIASFTAGFSLSYAYAKKHGLPDEAFLNAFGAGPLHVPLLDYKIPLMKKEEYTPPMFPAVHLLKDVNLFLSSLPEGVNAGGLEAVKSLLEKTGERDSDEMRDFAALFDTILNG